MENEGFSNGVYAVVFLLVNTKQCPKRWIYFVSLPVIFHRLGNGK